MGFVSFPDKDLDALQLGGALVWGPPPEVRYNQDRTDKNLDGKTPGRGWENGVTKKTCCFCGPG